MRPTPSTIAGFAVVLVLLGVLAAGQASALYVVTPLRLSADDAAADVGDTIRFTIDAENESTAADWAGRTVVVRYAYDTSESANASRDEPTSNESYRTAVLLPALPLDEKAHATFEWTVPAEVDDHNVGIRVESPEGELLAVADVAVGDAPPVMRILAGTGAPEPAEGGAIEPAPLNATPADDTDAPAESSKVPALGAFAALATAAVVALILARKR